MAVEINGKMEEFVTTEVSGLVSIDGIFFRVTELHLRHDAPPRVELRSIVHELEVQNDYHVGGAQGV